MSITELRGQTAFITGGSKGIGRAIAVALAKEGVNICVTARSEGALQEVVEQCEGFGVRAMKVVEDASNYVGLCDAMDKCVKEMGSLQILVSNGAYVDSIGNELTINSWHLWLVPSGYLPMGAMYKS